MLCALRFYATGSFQTGIGMADCVIVSQSVVSRFINEVPEAIVENLSDKYIRFPSEHSLDEMKLKFFEKFGMPGVVGLVDGTQIHIKKLKIDVEHVYYAVRKSAHTKNVQVICDMDLKIIALNPRYGGSTHDSYVWNNFYIKTMLKQEYDRGVRNSYLLGDSGYGQQPWLFTLILRAQNVAEELYNKVQQKTRHTVERCIGVLKSRFRCISRNYVLQYSPATAGSIVIAYAVLHNMMIESKYPLPPEASINENLDEPTIDEDNDPMSLVDIRNAGNIARNTLIREHFGLR